MSKCVLCGRELLTGDIHWEQGLCNECYNKTKNSDPYFDIVVDTTSRTPDEVVAIIMDTYKTYSEDKQAFVSPKII